MPLIFSITPSLIFRIHTVSTDNGHEFQAKFHWHALETLASLHIRFICDIMWLLIKSKDKKRFMKIRAYISSIRDYNLGRSDKGPGVCVWTHE